MAEPAEASPREEPAFDPESAPECREHGPETPPREGATRAARRLWTPLLLLVILFGGAALRMRDFDQPWKNANPSQALKGFGGALYSTIARNHVRYGLVQTRGAMINCGGRRAVPELGNHRYLNHPPLYAVLLALHFHAFGDSEPAARLFPLVFSILSLLMMFAVMRLVAGTPAALAATALMATLPMAVYYGTFVEVQSFQVMFVSLVVFWFYWKWHLSRRSVFALGCLAAVLAGAALDWPAYLLAFGIFLHHLIAPGPAGRSKTIWLGLPAVVAVAFGLTLAYVVRLSAGNDASPLLQAFVVESLSGARTLQLGGGWRLWAEALLRYFTGMYTWPMLILAAVWIGRALLAALFRRAPAGSGFVFAYVCMGAGYVAGFPTGSTIHEYWSMYLIPVFCAAAALLLAEASRWTLAVGTVALAAWLGVTAWARYEPRIDYEQSFYVQAGRAIQEVTEPEDTLTVLAVGTEEFLYAYYADRTVKLIDPYRLDAASDLPVEITGRWLVAPRDLDQHPLRNYPANRARFEAVRDRLFQQLGAGRERRDVGPLIFLRTAGSTVPDAISPRGP